MEKALRDENYNYLKVRFKKPFGKINKSYSCHTVIPEDTLSADSILIEN
jgi:hypothetical protein